MNFRLGKMQLRSHPMLPVLCILLWLTGKGEILLPSLLAFFWHECGHLIVSLLLGKKIESMELTPMGGMNHGFDVTFGKLSAEFLNDDN